MYQRCSVTRGLAVALAAAIFAVSGCTGSDCSRKQVAASRTRLVELQRRLKDAERLAGVTSRIALAGPVESLQAIKRDIDALEVPSCMRRARYLLAAQAELDATGFLAFMADGSEGESVAAVASASAREHSQWFDAALSEVAVCTPDCPQLAQWTEANEQQRIKLVHEQAALAAKREADAKAQAEREAAERQRERARLEAAAAERRAKKEAAEMEESKRQQAAAVLRWHRQLYMPVIAPLRAATAEADAAFKTPTHDGIQPACARIAAAANRALSGRVVADCPDRWAGQRTQALLESYALIADTCQRQDWKALADAGREMTRLTAAMSDPLRHYGLRP